MEISISAAASGIGARHIGGEGTFDGASIDTRTIASGELFTAIVADRDGHDYVQAARDAGAAAALVSSEWYERLDVDAGLPLVVVDDTADGLIALGNYARKRISGDVIGITGSVGKTSTKDFTAAALGGSDEGVSASQASFNNEMGVPITLLEAPAEAKAVVVEMGARGIGHIELLCDIAEPSVGIVTRVAHAHTEMFGSLENVAAAKGELPESVPETGFVVLNGDDQLVRAMASRTEASVATYGVGSPHAQKSGLSLLAFDITLDQDLRPSFKVASDWGSAEVTLSASGTHMASNAAAALTTACLLGVSLDVAGARLADAAVSSWRMQVERTDDGLLLVNDAYNANPTSMRAALASFSLLRLDSSDSDEGNTGSARKVAVLGEMAELGPDSEREHEVIAEYAGELGIETIAVAASHYGSGATHVDGVDEAISLIRSMQDQSGGVGAVLLKGSRVAALERVAESLLNS